MLSRPTNSDAVTTKEVDREELGRFLHSHALFSPPSGYSAYGSTLNKQGATGPALATKAYGVERVGLETIVVPAGTFSTLHLRSGEVETPQQLASADFSYDIWVTDDEYRLAVLSMYKGKARYQLTELSRSND